MDIKKAIKNIPKTPGIYLFFDKFGDIIYIGKAANLKKRVSGYFRKKLLDRRIELLVSNTTKIDYIPTSSSAEALLYEASMIKKKRPKYNIALKDDKAYPYLKLIAKEPYPRLTITRKYEKNGSVYYGPYTNVKLLRRALSMMKRIFPLRTCNKIPNKSCLNLSLGQCLGPCVNKDIDASYRETVGDVKLFLKGRKKQLIKRLSKRMNKFSGTLEYEKALKIKNQIEALSAVVEEGRPLFPLDRDLRQLKEAIGLGHIPARIEAFDISNISGYGSVGSMVTFFNSKPLKKDYRRYRVKTVSEIDDYAMTREIVRRRYSRLIQEKKNLPDLILIDGGKGHLNAAYRQLKELGLKLPLIAIAKKPERILKVGKKGPINLSYRSKAFKLIQRIRDEAHRFAITYQKIVRKKTFFN